jgi:hypothetical protein
MAGVPLLPGSRSCRLATIPRQPPTPTASTRLSALTDVLDQLKTPVGSPYITSARTEQKTLPPTVPLLVTWPGVTCPIVASLFIAPLPSNGQCLSHPSCHNNVEEYASVVKQTTVLRGP